MEENHEVTRRETTMPKSNMSTGEMGSKGGLKRVLVEMRVSKSQGTMYASNLAAELNVSFQLDTDYAPVPISPSPNLTENLTATKEDVVIVRGTIEANKIQELKAQPNVVDVWSDPEIQYFKKNDDEAFGTCPIPPCDCNSSIAKGTIQDVAQYLGVNQIWESGYKGEGIVIGMVDDGVNKAEISNVIGGWPSDWGSRGDHGNMTATDAMGMAPKAQLYDIRILGNDNESFLSNAIQGYQWAINQHRAQGTPHILSNSWGIYQKSWAEDYAINPNHPFTRKVIEAINQGILVLFAAGNCGEQCPTSRCGSDVGPGKDIWGANGHPQVMTVGAVNRNGNWIGYSSQGPAALDPHKPDFCSISHFKGYTPSDNGTSAACPIAAGVVALLKQANPSLTQEEAKNALKDTAKDIGSRGWDENSGAGIINAKAALDRIVTVLV